MGLDGRLQMQRDPVRPGRSPDETPAEFASDSVEVERFGIVKPGYATDPVVSGEQSRRDADVVGEAVGKFEFLADADIGAVPFAESANGLDRDPARTPMLCVRAEGEAEQVFRFKTVSVGVIRRAAPDPVIVTVAMIAPMTRRAAMLARSPMPASMGPAAMRMDVRRALGRLTGLADFRALLPERFLGCCQRRGWKPGRQPRSHNDNSADAPCPHRCPRLNVIL